jgi:hypothetical protein
VIYPPDAPELECLHAPQKLLGLSPAALSDVLANFAKTTFTDYYALKKAPVPEELPQEQTMLARQVAVLAPAFSEWPSKLAELTALMLCAKTPTPSAAFLRRWNEIRDHGAFIGLPTILKRSIDVAAMSLPGYLVPESFSAFCERQNGSPRPDEYAANFEVWTAGTRIFTASIWLLSFSKEASWQAYLAGMLTNPNWRFTSFATALLWSLARPADEQALKILETIDSRCLSLPRRRALFDHIGRIKESIASAAAIWADVGAPGLSSRLTDRLKEMEASGYYIAAQQSRALEVLDEPPVVQDAILALLESARGAKPATTWLSNRERVLKTVANPEALRQALVGVVAAYNEITTVRPALSMQEFEASQYFQQTGREQPANPTARGIAERERARAVVDGRGIPHIDRLRDVVLSFARGAHWMLAPFANAELVGVWTHTVEAWSRMGDPSPPVANAALYALAQADPALSAEALQSLRVRIRHKNLAKRIASTFDAMASRRGLSPDDLADELVPDHGLDSDGAKAWVAGGWQICLSYEVSGSMTLSYVDPTGTIRKALPKSVVEASADTLKAARADRKALGITVAAQRARFEDAMISGRRWDAATWSRTVARHPILSRLARRLVWRLDFRDQPSRLAMGLEAGDWRDVTGVLLGCQSAATISLPHPGDVRSEELSAWQGHIIKAGVVQPFKQVFRETYAPTTDERDRLVFTRFKGLVVPIQTVRALMTGRGWTGGLGLAGFDGAGQGERSFAQFGVRAFATHGEDAGGQYADLQTLEFFGLEHGPPIALGSVPSIPFSEAVRDLDLVASAATDSLGNAAVFGWQSGSAYDVVAAAQALARVSVVRAITSSLGIADRVTFAGSYALVGDRYRVHLGTGLVTRAGRNERVQLPVDTRRLREIRLPFEDRNEPIGAMVGLIHFLACETD